MPGLQNDPSPTYLSICVPPGENTSVDALLPLELAVCLASGHAPKTSVSIQMQL